jgi:cytoskeletal protein CcmA (bactofilin family)
MRTCLGIIVLFLAACQAHSQGPRWEHLRFISPRFSGASVEARQTIQDDVTLLGSSVEVAGTVYGDVLAIGAVAHFPGTVAGDILAIARTVDIDGTVYDDARIVSANASVGTFVASNLDAWCSSLRLAPGSEIGGSVSVVTGDCEVFGTIIGDLRGVARQTTIGGHIAGDVELLVAESLTFLPGTRIDGDLSYISYQAATIPEGVEIRGAIQHTVPPDTPRRVLVHARRISRVVGLLSLFLVGLVLIGLAPQFTTVTAQTLSARPLASLLTSLCTIVGMPLLMIALAATLIGIPLAALVGAAYLVILCLSPILLSFMLGRGVLKLATRSSQPSSYASLIIGFVPVAILLALPYTRLLVWAIAVVLGLGSAVLTGWNRYRQARRLDII